MAPLVAAPESSNVPALEPYTVTLKVECAEHNLDFAMLLTAEPKSRVPFQKLLAACHVAGLVGPAFDSSQEDNFKRFEAATQCNDAVRRERHDFYTRVEARFSDLMETTKRMKRDYYREVDHLRGQLSSKRRNPDFEPEDVVFFDPDGYKLPGWSEIVAQLDDMRMKRELLEKETEIGGDRVRCVPVSMLCQRCRNKFQTPEEQRAAYCEEHCDQGVQCDTESETQFVDGVVGEHRSMSVQTDWVPVLRPLMAGGKHSWFSGPGGTRDSLRTTSSATLEGTPCSDPEGQPIGKGNSPSFADLALGLDEGCSSLEPSTGQLEFDTQDGDDALCESASLCGDGATDGQGFGQELTAQASSADLRQCDSISDTRSCAASAMSLDTGEDEGSLQNEPGISSNAHMHSIGRADAVTQTGTTHGRSAHRGGPSSSNRKKCANAASCALQGDAPAVQDVLPQPGAEAERAQLLSTALERIFSRDPGNQRRRAFKMLRQKTMNRKQRAVARLARQMESIRKHVERQAFARWKGAVRVGNASHAERLARSMPNAQTDGWQRGNGPALQEADVGGLFGTHAGSQQMAAAGDARAQIPKGSNARLNLNGWARLDHQAQPASVRKPLEGPIASRPPSASDELATLGLSRPPSACVTPKYPWEKRMHSNESHEGELGSASVDFRSQTSLPASPFKVSRLGSHLCAARPAACPPSPDGGRGVSGPRPGIGKCSSAGSLSLPSLVTLG